MVHESRSRRLVEPVPTGPAAKPPAPRGSDLFDPADIDEMFERPMVAVPLPPPLSGAHYHPAGGDRR